MAKRWYQRRLLWASCAVALVAGLGLTAAHTYLVSPVAQSSPARTATPRTLSTPFAQADAPAGSYNPNGGVSNGVAPTQAVVPGTAQSSRSSVDAPPRAVFTSSATVIDTTARTMSGFELDVSAVPKSSSGAPVIATENTCLASYAARALPILRSSYIKSAEICGHRVAAIAGGYSTTERDLLSHAAFNPKDSALRPLIFGSPSLSYASVASSDGKAVMVLVAPKF
jgi:hypothetical protein